MNNLPDGVTEQDIDDLCDGREERSVDDFDEDREVEGRVFYKCHECKKEFPSISDFDNCEEHEDLKIA